MKCPLNSFKPCKRKECFLYLNPEIGGILDFFLAPLDHKNYNKKTESCGLAAITMVALDYLAQKGCNTIDKYHELSFEHLGGVGIPDEESFDFQAAIAKMRRLLRDARSLRQP